MRVPASHAHTAGNRRSRKRLAWHAPGWLVLALASPAAMALTSSPAELAELSLEDLLQVEVSSASRFAQSIEEAPATVSVIGQDELQQRGYRNMAEALVTLPGIYASNDHSYTYLGVRGFNRPGDYGTRILLLTDGAKRNDPLYDQALFGNEAPIEIDWVKRLEFVAGPTSAVYGANALFGTANAVMLDGGDINGSRVTLTAGSQNSKKLGIVAGQRLDAERDWFLGVAAYATDGRDFNFPEYASSNGGNARGLDGESYRKIYGKYRWGNWRLSANFNSRDKDLPTAMYGTSFGESGTRVRDESRLIELRYTADAGRDWQPSFRVFSGAYRYTGDYNYASANPGSLNARDEAQAEWFGGEAQLAYTGLAQHKLLVGMDSQWNTRLQQKYYEISSATTILDTNNPSRSLSLFVQDEWRFHPEWILNVGLRHDRHSDFKGETSPRVALIWQATPRLNLKAMSGSAYRVANAYERFYNDGDVSQKSNPNLQPEHVRSHELSASYRFSEGGRVGASLYENRISQLIDQRDDGSGVTSYVNQNQVDARGIELSAENRWAGGSHLRGSVAWQQSRHEDGRLLDDSPKWMGKLAYRLPLFAGWSASGEILGLSARHGSNGPVPGYGIVNLSLLSADFARAGQFSVTVYNLGDRRYFDPGSVSLRQRAIEQDGRQVLARWTLPF